MDIAKHVEATMLLLDAVASQKKAVNAMQVVKDRMNEDPPAGAMVTLPMEDFVAMTKGAVVFTLLTAGITGSKAQMKEGMDKISRGETPDSAGSVKQIVELMVKGMVAVTEDNEAPRPSATDLFPFNHITPEGKVE